MSLSAGGGPENATMSWMTMASVLVLRSGGLEGQGGRGGGTRTRGDETPGQTLVSGPVWLQRCQTPGTGLDMHPEPNTVLSTLHEAARLVFDAVVA